MFFGQTTQTCDEKWRVPVPADLRKVLPGEVILTAGYERCIWILPKDEFDKLFAPLNAAERLLDPQAHVLQRHFFGSAYPTTLDRQNRIRIPEALRDYIGLTEQERQVTFVSAGHRVELWPAHTYRDYRQQDLTKDNILDRARRLGLTHDATAGTTAA